LTSQRVPEALLVDTSVLIRFFRDHADEPQRAADGLLQAFLAQELSLFLLDLSIYELINILVRRLTRSGKEVAADVDAVFDLGAPVFAIDRESARRTASIAARTGLSGYDAAFVAASSLLGVPLVTADVEIVRRANKFGVLDLLSLV
jgi:predicted nucleic acid-binding protein